MKNKQNTGMSVVFEGIPGGLIIVAAELQVPDVLMSRLVLVDIDRRLAFGSGSAGLPLPIRLQFRPVRRTCDHPRTRTDRRINQPRNLHATSPAASRTALPAASLRDNNNNVLMTGKLLIIKPNE